MVEGAAKEEDQPDERGRANVLTIMLAGGLSFLLAQTEVLPNAEAFLVSFSSVFVLAYWIPPRPAQSFKRWTIEHLVLAGGVYAALYKIPTSLRLRFHVLLAYVIPIGIFVILFIVLSKLRFFNFGRRA